MADKENNMLLDSTCVEGNDAIDMEEDEEGGEEEGGEEGADEEDDSDWVEGDDEGDTGEDEDGEEEEGDEEPEEDQHAVGQLWLPGEWVELLFRYQIADHLVHPASDVIGDERAQNTMGFHQFLMGHRLGGVRPGYSVYSFFHDTLFHSTLLRLIADMLPVRSSPASHSIPYQRSLRRRTRIIPVEMINLTVVRYYVDLSDDDSEEKTEMIDLTMSDDDSEEKTE